MPGYERTSTDIKPDVMIEQINDLLDVLGESRLDSAPYDTAWLARLSAYVDLPEFKQALAWLRDHQYADGSWGGQALYYHDRFICTLAAIIALRVAGQGRHDAARIRHGERFIWENLGRLHIDVGDTIAFPVLVVSLIREARNLGLDVPAHVTQNVAVIEKKLNLLGSDPRRWRYTSMSFSLEAVPPYLPDQSAFASADFILENGSVGTSPAATAAHMIYTGHYSTTMLDYLQRAVAHQGDGGVPDITPAELFEIAWSLHPLWVSGAITPDHPSIRRHLQSLWAHWSPESGTSCSEYFPVPDLDDTATVFSLLRWGGYPVNADVFTYYENDSHFQCYPGEANFSLSVNIRTLAALQTEKGHPQYDGWNQKISTLLRRYDLDHLLWFDKWHISPYYLTNVAVSSLHGVLDELLPSRIQWIIKTQKADGGWGYFNGSTPEETALGLQALLFWDRHVARIDSDVLDAAAHYLMTHYRTTNHVPFYIGKCLYMPQHVVQATILAALYAYATH